jgi:hypothetical protein
MIGPVIRPFGIPQLCGHGRSIDRLSLLRALEKAACEVPHGGQDLGGREVSPPVTGEAALRGDLVPRGDKELLNPSLRRRGKRFVGDGQKPPVEAIEDCSDQVVLGRETVILRS